MSDYVDRTWLDQAKCAGHPIFLEDNPPRKDWYPICKSCPVIDTCLLFAIENKEKGIWGGTTEHDRKRLPKSYLKAIHLRNSTQTQESHREHPEQSAMEVLVSQARIQAQVRTKEVLADLSALLLDLQDIS